MTISELCIRRPVFATVLSLIVIALGLLSATRLPIRELPDIDTATVTISTVYTGAAPEVIDTQITEVIEAAISSVAGIRLIDSSSQLGSSRVRVEFNAGRDIDQAANDVRGAVGRVVGALPTEADDPVIFKNDSTADPIIRISIISSQMTASEITDYARRFLVDRIATLDGVASVDVFGARDYAMRVALDPKAMAARRLTVAEIADALRANNLELPAGEVVSMFRQFQLRTATRLVSPDQFRNLVVKVVDGAPVRLGDVANVFLGVENDDMILRSSGSNAVGLGVTRQSQSNTIAISQAVRAELDRIRPDLPAGMEIGIGSDDALFIRQSIEEVVKTLAIAVALVVVVIFLFLGSPRATIVPAVTIPVALIGAFVGIFAFGFSINILTLFALILAIGIVVDDAIVVLENIQRRVERGQPPVVAAVLGSREVTFAVLATSVTLISVFVPISFLDGQIGRLFTEFGLVLAMAVIVSTFVALTLCPMLCHKLLRRGSGGMLERVVNRVFGAIERGYATLLRASLAYPLVVIAMALAIAGASVWLYARVPQELSPREDRGVFFVAITAPQGSTVEFTDREAREVEARLQPLLDEGLAAQIFSIVGWRGEADRGFVVVRLTDWASRDQNAQTMVQRMIGPMVSIPGARAFPIMPAGLGLRGSRTPLQVKVQGPDFGQVQEWSKTLMARLEENPSLLNLETDYEETQPELRVDVNRALADDLGVSVQEVGTTLQTLFASREVTEFLDRGREYPVILQAQEDSRRTSDDLDKVYVRSQTTGTLVPLSSLLTIRETTASPELNRFNRLPAIELGAALADGYDLGTAIADVRAAAAEVLPPEAQIAFDGQSKEYLESSGGVVVTFIFALIIVYLVLAAQFESFIDPATIMLSVPLSVTGALLTIWVTGQSLNIYTQIGMVLLVGLMAKNGILIVEFANQLRDRGLSVREATLEGSVRRLRPILMTVLSTVLGAAPLMLSTGAGSESRAAIGVVIIGGFGIASVLTLFLTPVLYDLMGRFSRPRAQIAHELEAALTEGDGRSALATDR
jgi:multidrug efflux pump